MDRIHRLGLSKGQYTQHRFIMIRLSSTGKSLDKEIYNRLKYKERVMNDAIENRTLDVPVESQREDVEAILSAIDG